MNSADREGGVDELRPCSAIVALVPEARVREGAHYRKASTPPAFARRSERSRDLAKFPFTTKADLRANYPFGMFAGTDGRYVRSCTFSGTTGKPPCALYQGGHRYLVLREARSIRAAGGRSTDIVYIAYGYGLFTGAWARTTAKRWGDRRAGERRNDRRRCS